MSQFFATLYSRCQPEHGRVVLWRKGQPAVFVNPTDPEACHHAAMKLDQAGDCYNLVNLVRVDAVEDITQRFGRGREDELQSCVAMVADIDCGHKKNHNYPSRDQAMAALDKMPLSPTMVVMSGQGLHAYWVLSKPADASTGQEREKLKAISRRWQQMLRDALKPFELDSTHDLARVLRPAGTANRKHGNTVEILTVDPECHHPLDAFITHVIRGGLGPIPSEPKPRRRTTPSHMVPAPTIEICGWTLQVGWNHDPTKGGR